MVRANKTPNTFSPNSPTAAAVLLDMAVNLSTYTKLFVAALACITWAQAAPVLPDTDASSNETATTHGFEFSAPNCSLLEPADATLSNRTHWDFAFGLNVLKTYLKGVLVSITR